MNLFISILLALTTSTCFCQLKLNVKLPTVSHGKAILYNYNNGQSDTFQFDHGNLFVDIAGSSQTFCDLIIDGYNNLRPLNFILSNQVTVVQFDTLIVSNEK